MSDSVHADGSSASRCCGRAMTVIGVDRGPDHGAGPVRLQTCPSCGRHTWRLGAREVDRAELLAALRVDPPAPRRTAVERRSAVPDDAARRSELQDLLGRFTVHGTSS